MLVIIIRYSVYKQNRIQLFPGRRQRRGKRVSKGEKRANSDSVQMHSKQASKEDKQAAIIGVYL
nr:hypothetical protein Q903MT_gene2517 [Picea sitchensis]